jgi:hypothetical protein
VDSFNRIPAMIAPMLARQKALKRNWLGRWSSMPSQGRTKKCTKLRK